MRAVILVAVFPWAKARLPQRGIDHIGMRRINHNIGAAGVCIFIEHLLPALPAVGGAKDTTLFIGTIRRADHGGKKSIGVARIDDQRRNLLSIAEAQMLPRLSRIARPINAVSHREIWT